MINVTPKVDVAPKAFRCLESIAFASCLPSPFKAIQAQHRACVFYLIGSKQAFRKPSPTHNKFVQYFSGISPLSEAESKAIEENMVVKTFKKGAYLLKEGQISVDTYFILEGFDFGEGFATSLRRRTSAAPYCAYSIACILPFI